MTRNLAFGGGGRPSARMLGSCACLAFVILLALAFWVGAFWIGQTIVRLSAGG